MTTKSHDRAASAPAVGGVRARRRSGVTLIEALIAMVVLGVLAAIAVPRYTSMRARSYVASVTSDLRNLAGRQEAYAAAHYTYTDDIALLEVTLTEDVTIEINEATEHGWAATGTHAGLGEKRCGLWVGQADPAGAGPATSAGVVSCDPVDAPIGSGIRGMLDGILGDSVGGH